jgi:hypothetical protein
MHPYYVGPPEGAINDRRRTRMDGRGRRAQSTSSSPNRLRRDGGRRIARRIEVNGVAHVILRVKRISEWIAFYDLVMPFLGLEAGPLRLVVDPEPGGDLVRRDVVGAGSETRAP